MQFFEKVWYIDENILNDVFHKWDKKRRFTLQKWGESIL